MAPRPSSEPVVENAQHDPHCPWFLTGVTTLPEVVQSTEAGGLATYLTDPVHEVVALFLLYLR